MASSSKSLEEMLTSDVDEKAFSALVGTLENTLDPTMTNQLNAAGHHSSVSANHVNKSLPDLNCATATGNCASTNQETSNNNNSASNNNLTSALVTVNSTPTSQLSNSPLANSPTVNSDTKRSLPVNNNNSVSMNSTDKCPPTAPLPVVLASQAMTSSPATTPLQPSNPQLSAVPASGYLNQLTNSPSTPAPASVPANQILQNAIKVSAMSNGNSSPSSCSAPSVLSSSLSSVPLQTPTTTNSAPTIRPPTNIALSAIQPSLLIAQNKTVTGAKPGQTVYIATTKDGPLLVQPSNPQASDNTNSSVGSTSVSGPTTSAVLAIATSRPIVSIANNTTVTGAGQNIVHQVAPNTSQPILQLVTNVNASRPAGAPNLQQQKQLAPRVVQLSPNVRLTPQVIRPGGPMQGTITVPTNLLRGGTILLKSENGQVHMVNVGPQITPTSTAASTGNLQGATYRFQMPTQGTPQPGVRNLGPHQQIVLPVSMTNALQGKTAPQQPPQVQPTQPVTIQTTTANAQAAATPSQMSPNTAKRKCKNFLSTLIRLASDQPEQVATNVKNLIQGLIDDAIQPEDFTNQLQKELNSSPQPCLVPFLKKSLPYLRYSLMQRELTIEGVRPPPQGAVTLPPQPQAIPQIQIAQAARPGLTPTTVRLLTPITGSLSLPHGAVLTTPLTHATQRLPTQQVANKAFSQPIPSISTPKPPPKTSSKSRSPASASKEKKFSSSLRDDDDINDVAAMGGVNLIEESQRILASNSEMIGQQIRSCKDENFLFTTPLNTRINKIAAKFGLEEASSDVVSLVSHAVQERLKTFVERLGIIAEHRQEQLKNDPRYEVTQDVKAQVQFLQELDRLEKRKHEEQEREVLMRAAKSRSKAEDPEQLRLKQRAKELQRQEMEELRQKEANETALQAIGNPRKKFKNSSPMNSSLSGSTTNLNCSLNSSPFSGQSSKPVKRVKRVSMRDLHFLLENDRDTVRSTTLYKAYAK